MVACPPSIVSSKKVWSAAVTGYRSVTPLDLRIDGPIKDLPPGALLMPSVTVAPSFVHLNLRHQKETTLDLQPFGTVKSSPKPLEPPWRPHLNQLNPKDSCYKSTSLFANEAGSLLFLST